MILACAAVGGCNTASTLSRRWINCCRRAVCGLIGDPSAASMDAIYTTLQPRCGRACPRHPRLCLPHGFLKTWMPGTNPGKGILVRIDPRFHGDDILAEALGGDKAVDLAVAEQPAAALLDHLVVIGAAGADLRALRAVLHDGPVGTDIGGGVAVEGDHDIGHEMHAARALVAGPGADLAGQRGDRLAASRLAKGGLPGAVLGEQCRHAVIPAAVEPEAVLSQHLANGVLFLEHARHLPSSRSVISRSVAPTR